MAQSDNNKKPDREELVPLGRFPIDYREQYDVARVVRHLQELLQTGKIDPDVVIPKLKELANTEKGDVQLVLAKKAIEQITHPVKKLIAKQRFPKGDDDPERAYSTLSKLTPEELEAHVFSDMGWVVRHLELQKYSHVDLNALTELLDKWKPNESHGDPERKTAILNRLYVLQEALNSMESSEWINDRDPQKYFEKLRDQGKFAVIAYLLQGMTWDSPTLLTKLTREQVAYWRDQCRGKCFIDDFCRIQQFLGEWDGEFSWKQSNDQAFDVGAIDRLELLMAWAESDKSADPKDRLTAVVHEVFMAIIGGAISQTNQRLWRVLDRWGACVYASMDEAAAYRGLQENGEHEFYKEDSLPNFLKTILRASFVREKNSRLPLNKTELALPAIMEKEWEQESSLKVITGLYLAHTYFLSETRQSQIRTDLLTRAYNDALTLPPYERAFMLVKLHEVKQELEGRVAMDEALRGMGATVIGKGGKPIAGKLAARNSG